MSALRFLIRSMMEWTAATGLDGKKVPEKPLGHRGECYSRLTARGRAMFDPGRGTPIGLARARSAGERLVEAAVSSGSTKFACNRSERP